MSRPGEQFIADSEVAHSMAQSSYNEQNTLWMHRMGRITLHPYDVSNLEQKADIKEEAILGNLDNVPIATGDIVSAEARKAQSEIPVAETTAIDNWVRTLAAARNQFAKQPSNDPARGKVKNPWGSKEGHGFVSEGMLNAANLWNGSSDEAWDTLLRHFTDPNTLEETITITQLESGNPNYDSPAPPPQPGRTMQVTYKITAQQCRASAREVEVDVKMQTAFRKASKSTLKVLTAFTGDFPVTPDQLSALLYNISQLTPREGRTWPIGKKH